MPSMPNNQKKVSMKCFKIPIHFNVYQGLKCQVHKHNGTIKKKIQKYFCTVKNTCFGPKSVELSKKWSLHRWKVAAAGCHLLLSSLVFSNACHVFPILLGNQCLKKKKKKKKKKRARFGYYYTTSQGHVFDKGDNKFWCPDNFTCVTFAF